jgi:hypothetical protein
VGWLASLKRFILGSAKAYIDHEGILRTEKNRICTANTSAMPIFVFSRWVPRSMAAHLVPAHLTSVNCKPNSRANCQDGGEPMMVLMMGEIADSGSFDGSLPLLRHAQGPSISPQIEYPAYL